ncbi:hypothetical protein M9H77_20926 [Catharanthus roseus]|uniref:Uncharacterized protein n=1 Tax=Catharanthus roseus TaxID=4058 RepID=A0ACC0AKX4_CATRO|nr:hypothetical protein M9H77_20926 [Catharanthus roseus]
MKEFEFEELEVATEKFSPSRLVGKGSHGHVYKGILQDYDHHQQIVAIKKQSLGLQKLQDNSKLENEVDILSSLEPQNNQFIINLVGISHDSSRNKVLVMEYLPNGNLHQLLHMVVGSSGSVPPPPTLTWAKRAQIAIQIAKAVEFLHEENPCTIIHRDIKSTNVLFDSDWNAKLADFGLALKLSDKLHYPPAGTIGYLDPCYSVPSKLSTKIDVFSFGVLLLEIISGKKVIDVLRSPSSIVEWAIPLIEKHGPMSEICDQRVDLPRFMEGTIRNMLNIASRCVLPNEENRPSMKEIVVELENKCILLEQPVVRMPVWLNLLQSLIVLKRQVKFFGVMKKLDNISSTTIFDDDDDDDEESRENDHDHVVVDTSSRGKLLLREILLADQCF